MTAIDNKRDAADIYIEHITTVCNNCAALLQAQIQDLKKLPKVKTPGHLIKSTSDGYVRWIRVLMPDESKSGKKERQYLSLKDEKLKKQLAFKIYCEAAVIVKEGQLNAIKAYIHSIEKISLRALRTFHDENIRKLLQQPASVSQQLTTWQQADYIRNPQHPEGLKIHADGGLMVRSKSEAIIVSELKKASISFRYECALTINDITIYPDFMIMHPLTGQIIIWEHLGMMDDKTYASSAGRKIETYIRSGYIPMVNLIITSETSERPLDYRFVQMLIEYYFVLSN